MLIVELCRRRSTLLKRPQSLKLPMTVQQKQEKKLKQLRKQLRQIAQHRPVEAVEKARKKERKKNFLCKLNIMQQ
jgi:hypothetical protein